MNITSTMKATFYADKFQGRKMANGKPFDNNKMTAALGSYMLFYTNGGVGQDAGDAFYFNDYIQVTSIDTGKSIIVQITDKKPQGKFTIDLSQAAFKALGFTKEQGWGWVRVQETTWEV